MGGFKEQLRGWAGSLALAFASILATTGANAGAEAEPDFIRGYAAGILEHAHSLSDFQLRLEGGILVVEFDQQPTTPIDTIERSLLNIEGVTRTRILVEGVVVADGEQVQPNAASAPATETPSDAESISAAETTEEGDAGYDLLSPYQMFRSLLADPRWPHFAAVYQSYRSRDGIGGAGSANFGESFALIRSPERSWGQWELGLQAGVFSVFDLGSESNDLVNSDFLIGLTATHRYGNLTSMLRVYHQSSHLGDEFLLRTRIDRVNLSFEVVDALLSYEPWEWLRLYGGGGLIVHRIPVLKRGIVQSGVELRSPRAFAGGFIRPIAALDLQFRQESKWGVDSSVRAGFQIEHPFLRRTQLQVLAEYYRGRSPNGQFYEQRIQTAGVGLHLGF